MTKSERVEMWPFKKRKAVTPTEKRAEAREYVYKYARGGYNEYQLIWVLSQYNYIPEEMGTTVGTLEDVIGWGLDKQLISAETHGKILRIRGYLQQSGFFNG